MPNSTLWHCTALEKTASVGGHDVRNDLRQTRGRNKGRPNASNWTLISPSKRQRNLFTNRKQFKSNIKGSTVSSNLEVLNVWNILAELLVETGIREGAVGEHARNPTPNCIENTALAVGKGNTHVTTCHRYQRKALSAT